MSLTAHISSCIWYFTINSENQVVNWSKQNQLDELGVYGQYISVHYYIIQTLATTGYGDMPPKNTTERIMAIILMIFGCLIYSLMVSNLSNLLCYKTEQQINTENMLSRLETINYKSKLPNELYKKVKKYFKFKSTPNLDHK